MNTKRPWLDDIVVGLSYYFITSLIVVLGVAFGREFVKPPIQRPTMPKDFLASMNQWDGLHYKSIVERGYFYDPERRSNVAFFPAYPLLGRLLVDATGMRTEAALLIVSHTFLAGGFILLRAYTRLRFPDAGPRMWDMTLLLFGVFPTTFFFRMTYTESLFVFLCLLALYGMLRRWPLVVIAFIVGAATATRPVGVALVPVFVLHLWQTRTGLASFVMQTLTLLPISCAGLLAYMAYLAAAFDDPLRFATAQEQWQVSAAQGRDKLAALVTLEPIWGVFLPSSPRYWAKNEFQQNPLFSLILANPIIFVGAVTLLLVGIRKGWLSGAEALLSAGLLLIPYVTKGHEMSMASAGRFAAVAAPLYGVGACLRVAPLSALPMIALLVLYSSLFAAGYLLF